MSYNRSSEDQLSGTIKLVLVESVKLFNTLQVAVALFTVIIYIHLQHMAAQNCKQAGSIGTQHALGH